MHGIERKQVFAARANVHRAALKDACYFRESIGAELGGRDIDWRRDEGATNRHAKMMLGTSAERAARRQPLIIYVIIDDGSLPTKRRP